MGEVMKMDLYKEILIHTLSEQRVEVRFPDLTLDAKQLVDSVCYRALRKIKEVVEDDTLEDKECFERIEMILQVLEQIGSRCGGRHDL